MTQRYFIPLLIAGTILFLIFVFFIISYVLIYTRKQQRNKLEKAQLLYEYEKKLLRTRLEEHERSMLQISKEIHDNVAQKIDFIHMNVKALMDDNGRQDNSRFIRNSDSMLQQVTNDLRNISYSLNSEYIQARGLAEVLSKELEYLKAWRNVACHLEMKGMYTPLSGEQELLMYRIAQEALHNILKYAQATRIDVLLDYRNGHNIMKIADNGVGFDASIQEKMNGLGFRNMKQRADLLNGELDIKSAVGKGCCITLTLKSQSPITKSSA